MYYHFLLLLFLTNSHHDLSVGHLFKVFFPFSPLHWWKMSFQFTGRHTEKSQDNIQITFFIKTVCVFCFWDTKTHPRPKKYGYPRLLTTTTSIPFSFIFKTALFITSSWIHWIFNSQGLRYPNSYWVHSLMHMNPTWNTQAYPLLTHSHIQTSIHTHFLSFQNKPELQLFRWLLEFLEWFINFPNYFKFVILLSFFFQLWTIPCCIFIAKVNMLLRNSDCSR